MNEENFKKELSKELDNLSTVKIKNLINKLVDKLPTNYYEYLICKIKYLKGEKYNIDDNLLKEYNRILNDFKKVEDGEICFKSYSYETGTYSYYDSDVDYEYYPSRALEEILIDTYELIKKLVLYREYGKAITLFELIINTNYTCEEVGNPEYDDSNEVYDTYEVSFALIKNNLGIDLNETCLYAIYSQIMNNKSDKFEKIWNYIKICRSIDINEVLNIGIEEIENFDKFYSEWTKFEEEKKNKK